MIDTIGLLYEAGEGGGEPLVLSGWHVNVTPAAITARPELQPFVVTPSVLRRVWAGDDPANPTQTAALRFADEAEALGFFPA